MFNYASFKTELRARLGNRNDLEDRLDRWVNYAITELMLSPRFMFFELDKKDTFTTVIGQREYTLHDFADLWHILDIRDMTNERKLLRTHWSYLDKVMNTTGQPTRYYRFGYDLVLDMIPDGEYVMQLRYRKRPIDASAANPDFEGLGTEWEEMLLTLAAVKGFEALKQTEQAANMRGLFEQKVATMNDVLGLEDYDSETTVGVSLVPRF
jgi:hypothetical protein